MVARCRRVVLSLESLRRAGGWRRLSGIVCAVAGSICGVCGPRILAWNHLASAGSVEWPCLRRVVYNRDPGCDVELHGMGQCIDGCGGSARTAANLPAGDDGVDDDRGPYLHSAPAGHGPGGELAV